jgi:hypothetical protein
LAGGEAGLPDWRDASRYRPLLRTAPELLAWEWLRRDPAYAAAARAAAPRERAAPCVMDPDPAAAAWGLHAFEDPQLQASAARPVWRRDWLARVLVAEAVGGGPAKERLDFVQVPRIATVARVAGGPEHWLLCDGEACLRVDVLAGSLLDGPAVLSFRLTGFASLHGPLETLRGLLRFGRTGSLPCPSRCSRNRRLVLLLRAWDGLRDGASQREIAAALLSGDALCPRWRYAAPGLRSQAQRLAQGAQAMGTGGWRALLGA